MIEIVRIVLRMRYKTLIHRTQARMTPTIPPVQHTDVAIVGAGILGLSHAYAFARRGLRVTVFERGGAPLGASIRNFGLVLVTGQPPGAMHALACASRDLWLGWSKAAGMHVRESGSLLFARTAAEADVIESFAQTRARQAGYDVELLDARTLENLYDGRFRHHRAALHGRADLQVYSREALPALVAYLRASLGVDFRFGTLVRDVDGGRVETTAGTWRAEHVVVCAGHDYLTLFAQELAALKPRVCRLQMLRARFDAGPHHEPGGAGDGHDGKPFVLNHAVLTGLSCLHYGAFADLPAVAALRAEVAEREPALLTHGIHLLASPTPHGDVIIGDSHDYGDDASPFNAQDVDDLLVSLAQSTFGASLRVIERWQGVYGASNGTTGSPFTVLQPQAGVTGVFMHSGVGMSIGPALGESVVANVLEGVAMPTV
jgi:D-hydroxyproline dehydrogenase subunit beta